MLGELSSISDVVVAALWMAETLDTADVWWRGQAKAEWRLIPGAMRLRGERLAKERYMARQFMLRARSRSRMCPDEMAALDWLVLMQHHGLPTRLLDWTESALVATYFAVSTHWDADACLWGLYPFGLNQCQVGVNSLMHGQHPICRRVVEGAFGLDCEAGRSTMAVVSPELYPRQLAQLSRLTVHGDDTPMEELPKNEGFLRQWIIPAKLKASLERDLYGLGIRKSCLFPDLDHLAQDLKGRPIREIGDHSLA